MADGQLSLVAAMAKQQMGQKYQAPFARKGWGRGAMGSMGAQQFRGRNSQAGLQKEVATLNSPVMRAFMEKMTPNTPITNFLNGVR